MIISVQKGLDGVRKLLEKNGYDVVDFDKSSNVVDAYIYYGKCEDDFSVEAAAELTNLDFAINRKKRVKAINCKNKSFKDIETELLSNGEHRKRRKF